MAQHLGYACWDPILRNLDASTRLQISLRCPLLQNLNSRLPIKTKSMSIGRNYIQMDDVKVEQTVVSWQEAESVVRKEVFGKLKSAEGKLAKQQRDFEFADDKKITIRTIENLKRSINFLKQRHTDLKPKRMDFHQLVANRDNQKKTVLGSALALNKSKTDVYLYLVNTIFRKNLRVDTINLAGVYEVMPKFDLSLLNQARFLVFDCTISHEILSGLGNSLVYCARNCIGTANLTVDLVADWQKKRRPIGTRYVFPCSRFSAERMMSYVERVAGARRVETTDKRSVIPYAIAFPLSEDSEIMVTCLKTSEIVMDNNYVQFHFVIQPKSNLVVL